MSEDKYIDVVFDGPPCPVTGRFVEAENMNGESIRCEWVQDGGRWRLRIRASDLLGEDGEKKQPAGGYGEPWQDTGNFDRIGTERIPLIAVCHSVATRKRIIDCVNAMKDLDPYRVRALIDELANDSLPACGWDEKGPRPWCGCPNCQARACFEEEEER